MNFERIKKQQGFTLIEMIIAISIFVLVLLVATNVYLTINNTQRKVVTMQRVQSDLRYLYEAIAQEIRLGRINYEFYSDSANGINLHPDAAGRTNYLLAVINQAGEKIFFRRSSQTSGANDGQGARAQYCQADEINDCALTNDDLWQDITPTETMIEDLRFIITPSADPFSEPAVTECPIGTECINGYVCQTSACKYYADGGNFQPKVTIIIKAKGVGANLGADTAINMQTTVSSRLFNDQARNENY